MKLYFDTRGVVWLAKYPQAGSATGWSDFVVITREEANALHRETARDHVHLSLNHRRV